MDHPISLLLAQAAEMVIGMATDMAESQNMVTVQEYNIVLEYNIAKECNIE